MTIVLCQIEILNMSANHLQIQSIYYAQEDKKVILY